MNLIGSPEASAAHRCRLNLKKDNPMPPTLTPHKLNHPAFAKRGLDGRTTPRRGDIWYVTSESANSALGTHRSVGHEIWSNRLAVVVSNNRMNSRSGFVQLVYLATAATRMPSQLHPQIDFPEGLKIKGADTAIAFCEQVHSVDLSRLKEFHGQIHPADLDNIGSAMRWALGLSQAGANATH